MSLIQTGGPLPMTFAMSWEGGGLAAICSCKSPQPGFLWFPKCSPCSRFISMLRRYQACIILSMVRERCDESLKITRLCCSWWMLPFTWQTPNPLKLFKGNWYRCGIKGTIHYCITPNFRKYFIFAQIRESANFAKIYTRSHSIGWVDG